MQIDITYSDDTLNAMGARRKMIEDIQKSYLEQIDVTSATSCCKAENVIRNMKSHSRILALQKEMESILLCAVPKIIIIAETEQEKEILKKRFLNESD